MNKADECEKIEISLTMKHIEITAQDMLSKFPFEPPIRLRKHTPVDLTCRKHLSYLMLRQNNCSFDNVYEVVDYLEDFEAELIEFVSTGGTLQLWVAFFSDTPMKGFCIPLALTKRLAAIGLDLHIFMYPRDALRLV